VTVRRVRQPQWLAVAAAIVVSLFTPGLASAAPVTVELLLLVDVSGSVDATEYDLQKQGYVDAFNDPGIQALIAAAPNGVAVAYAEWASGGEQALLVGWTNLTDAASASAFGAAIGASARAFVGNTGPGSAINWGAPLFAGNGFEGTRLVMDVSGDGSQNSGDDTFAAATAAKAAGITINGLPILGSEPDLDDWYQGNIVTPGGGFLVVASDFTSFSDAVRQKIGREIQVPEPAVMALFGFGLVAAARRSARRTRG
jgi:hypothetical protein